MSTNTFEQELIRYINDYGFNKEHFQYSRYLEGHLDIGRFDKYFDMIEKFKPLKNSSVLEIGCGSGGTIENLAKRGAKVSGIEIKDDLVRLSKMRASQFEGCSCIKADADTLPFPDKAFDVCSSMDLIEHLEDPEKHFKEMIRVLKPGGIISISTPNWYFHLERHTRFRFIHRFPLKWAKAYTRFIQGHKLFSEEYRQRLDSMHTLNGYYLVRSLKRLGNKFGLKILWYRPNLLNYNDAVIHMLFQKKEEKK